MKVRMNWVCIDHANGDGSGQYVWVCPTRADACRLRHRHARQGLARLGPPHLWSVDILRRYRFVAITVDGVYLVRLTDTEGA